MKTIAIKNGYDFKDAIKAVGGKFSAARAEWSVTEEGLAKLIDRAVDSYRRSNKRDRALGVAFAACTLDIDGDEISGKDYMAPALETAEALSSVSKY